MKMKNLFAMAVCSASLAMAMEIGPAMAQSQDDPGPAAYHDALKGKRVVLVPMAMVAAQPDLGTAMTLVLRRGNIERTYRLVRRWLM